MMFASIFIHLKEPKLVEQIGIPQLKEGQGCPWYLVKGQDQWVFSPNIHIIYITPFVSRVFVGEITH